MTKLTLTITTQVFVTKRILYSLFKTLNIILIFKLNLLVDFQCFCLCFSSSFNLLISAPLMSPVFLHEEFVWEFGSFLAYLTYCVSIQCSILKRNIA